MIVFADSWLANSVAFNVGANVIQWTSGPGTVAAVVAFLWMRWHRRCHVPFCIRLGEHPVSGTRFKVCHRHHTLDWHRVLHDLHMEKFSHLLAWGESHGRPPKGVTKPHVRRAE